MLFHGAVSFHTWRNPSFYFGALWRWLTCFDVSCPCSFLSLCRHFSSPPRQDTPHLPLLLFFKVLAGMNVHPAEFDGLKQEYNVKGYPTFCYFEWVESSHPSHFRLSPPFQSSEHQSKATSNRKCSPGLWSTSRHDGSRLAAHVGFPWGSEVASTRCKGESFWQPWGSFGIPFLKKVNSQEVVKDVGFSWVPLSNSEGDTQCD